MSIESFPYPSISGDRKYTAAQEAAGRAAFVTSGIVSDVTTAFECSKVTDSMDISVAAGEAIIVGHPVIMDAADTVAISAGNATNPRIDIVCLESNSNTGVRASRIVVVAGTPAASPVAPTLTQTAEQYQCPLCQVLVPVGATTLNSATLTDLREAMEGRHVHGEEGITAGAVSKTRLHSGVTGMIPSLDDCTAILATDNLNTYMTPGSFIWGGGTVTNGPTTLPFRLYVRKFYGGSAAWSNSNYVQHEAIISDGTMVCRNTSNAGSTWSDWVRTATILYGTSATPPAGTYPAGTLYIQYEA